VFETPQMDGLRVDAGVETGSVISPYYDSMIAKLIAAGPDRGAAAARLAQALEETAVAGPRTNAAFLHALVTHPAFESARMDTGLIGRELDRLAPAGFDAKAVGFGVMHMLWQAHEDAELSRPSTASSRYSPWGAQDAFQLGAPRREQRTVLVNGVATRVEVRWGSDGPDVSVTGEHAAPPWERRTIRVVSEGNPLYVLHDMRQTELAWPTFDAGALDEGSNGSSVRAPIIGRVAKVFVNVGDAVAKGDRIAVVEAMKMEHVLHAPRDGVIEKLAAKEGQQVTQGALIASLAE
jgi:3-methylcrotonyl-CoA carboxylase alpha subunit